MYSMHTYESGFGRKCTLEKTGLKLGYGGMEWGRIGGGEGGEGYTEV